MTTRYSSRPGKTAIARLGQKSWTPPRVIMSAKRCEPKPTKTATPVAGLPVIHHKGAPKIAVASSKASRECRKLRWPKTTVEFFGDASKLATEPALGVVRVGQE